MVVRVKSSTRKSKPKPQGNYIDVFVKRMFGRVMVFADFLVNYADPKFVAEIDVENIQSAPTHHIGQKGDERIIDLVFQCPLKNGGGSLTAVIIFEHENSNLKRIPQKLLKYISAIWSAQLKEGKPLSAPYFIVLVCLKYYIHTKYVRRFDNNVLKSNIHNTIAFPKDQFAENESNGKFDNMYNRDRLVDHRA